MELDWAVLKLGTGEGKASSSVRKEGTNQINTSDVRFVILSLKGYIYLPLSPPHKLAFL